MRTLTGSRVLLTSFIFATFFMTIMFFAATTGGERDDLTKQAGTSDVGTSVLGDAAVCNHETEIAALKVRLSDRDASIQKLGDRIGELEDELAEAERLAAAREKMLAALRNAQGNEPPPPPDASGACPRTGISRSAQEQAKAVFDEFRKDAVPGTDTDHDFCQRALRCYGALAAVWGTEKLDRAIVDAKRAVFDDLGNPPYTTEVYEGWRAKNPFAARMFDWFGHL